MAFLIYILHSMLPPQSRKLFGVCILHPGSHKHVQTLGYSQIMMNSESATVPRIDFYSEYKSMVPRHVF